MQCVLAPAAFALTTSGLPASPSMVKVAVTRAEQVRMDRYRHLYSLAKVLKCYRTGMPLPDPELAILDAWGVEVQPHAGELWLETRTETVKGFIVSEVAPLLVQCHDLDVHMQDHGPQVVWLTLCKRLVIE
jgi:hypothetical protein